MDTFDVKVLEDGEWKETAALWCCGDTCVAVHPVDIANFRRGGVLSQEAVLVLGYGEWRYIKHKIKTKKDAGMWRSQNKNKWVCHNGSAVYIAQADKMYFMDSLKNYFVLDRVDSDGEPVFEPLIEQEI